MSPAASCRRARPSHPRSRPRLPQTAGAAASAALDEAATAIEQAQGAEARQHAALRFWDAVVDAADSIVFRMLFNSLRLAYEPAIKALGPVMDAEVDNVAGYRSLADAVSRGDRDAAHAAADALLRPATDALGGLLAALDT